MGSDVKKLTSDDGTRRIRYYESERVWGCFEGAPTPSGGFSGHRVALKTTAQEAEAWRDE